MNPCIHLCQCVSKRNHIWPHCTVWFGRCCYGRWACVASCRPVERSDWLDVVAGGVALNSKHEEFPTRNTQEAMGRCLSLFSSSSSIESIIGLSNVNSLIRASLLDLWHVACSSEQVETPVLCSWCGQRTPMFCHMTYVRSSFLTVVLLMKLRHFIRFAFLISNVLERLSHWSKVSVQIYFEINLMFSIHNICFGIIYGLAWCCVSIAICLLLDCHRMSKYLGLCQHLFMCSCRHKRFSLQIKDISVFLSTYYTVYYLVSDVVWAFRTKCHPFWSWQLAANDDVRHQIGTHMTRHRDSIVLSCGNALNYSSSTRVKVQWWSKTSDRVESCTRLRSWHSRFDMRAMLQEMPPTELHVHWASVFILRDSWLKSAPAQRNPPIGSRQRSSNDFRRVSARVGRIALSFRPCARLIACQCHVKTWNVQGLCLVCEDHSKSPDTTFLLKNIGFNYPPWCRMQLCIFWIYRYIRYWLSVQTATGPFLGLQSACRRAWLLTRGKRSHLQGPADGARDTTTSLDASHPTWNTFNK